MIITASVNHLCHSGTFLAGALVVAVVLAVLLLAVLLLGVFVALAACLRTASRPQRVVLSDALAAASGQWSVGRRGMLIKIRFR